MTLSAKDHQILTEIERELVVTEPQLARALRRGRLPRLRRSAVAARGDAERGRRGWITGACALLLSGVALLVIGLISQNVALVWAGVLLAQLGPVLAARIYKRSHRHSPRFRTAPASPGDERGGSAGNTGRR